VLKDIYGASSFWWINGDRKRQQWHEVLEKERTNHIVWHTHILWSERRLERNALQVVESAAQQLTGVLLY
jgi:hypothetical protein